MTKSVRQVIASIGHAFETHALSEREFEHAALLGDEIAKHDRYRVPEWVKREIEQGRNPDRMVA